MIGIGVYAFREKWRNTGIIKVDTIYDIELDLSIILLDITLVLIISGAVIFIVSFTGCLGSLRENTCLLKFVSI